MTTLLLILHVLVSLFLIIIVLLQHGKGADVGATFGGSSQSLMGTEGAVPLMNKITTLAAIVFMGTSITLAYMSAHDSTGTVMKDVQVKQVEVPAVDTTPVTIPLPAADNAATQAAPTPEKKAE
ncbi:MAG: preprotein translocase subunit SecG [Desulfobulbus sp.]|nr:MAG: preprotein translocase subunit SecG [Desulfobulbus sp.]RUM38663.1 MAG: preprotein translocase subunit SecG [Desulfobulbus sp.]